MTLHAAALKPGNKFRDNGLVSQPDEYKLHRITGVSDTHVMAKHLATGNDRRFPRTIKAMASLTLVNDFADLQADLDCLVGDKVVLELEDTSRISGDVTAILYHTFNLDGETHRQLSQIELDRSGSTRFPLQMIRNIKRINHR